MIRCYDCGSKYIETGMIFGVTVCACRNCGKAWFLRTDKPESEKPESGKPESGYYDQKL